MKIFRDFESLPNLGGVIATIGSFDGVHRGHLSLLESVKDLSESSGRESVVLTFEPHPRVVLGRAEGLRLLTSTEEKILLLERIGIDNLVIIPFNRNFSRLSYRDFVRLYLVEKLNISMLVVGHNHHLGRGSEGGYLSMLSMATEFGFGLLRVGEWSDSDGGNVSSTVIRRLLSMGDVERANRLLYNPYIVVGHADGDGRVWAAEPLKLIPHEGEYEAMVDGVESRIRIDANGVMWCEECGQDVVIELLKKC